MFTVYALHSPTFNKIYIGFTSRNPEERLFAHNHLEKNSFTSKFRPWIIIYTETHETKAAAMAREKQLKTAKGREFIRNLIPS
jgi:putative endonuclease